MPLCMFLLSACAVEKIKEFPKKYQGTWARNIGMCSAAADYAKAHPIRLHINSNSISHSRWFLVKQISVLSISIIEKNKIEASLKFYLEDDDHIKTMTFKLIAAEDDEYRDPMLYELLGIEDTLELSEDTDNVSRYYKCPVDFRPNKALRPSPKIGIP